ncbi:MAG: aminoacyl-tRNA hydrolase [Phycisphaerae bacterium]|nr:aminoacyl-tRNA hydrolase [Phycisphaerae bacterium]
MIGLGNPGRRYKRTRHNVGFDVVDALVARWGLGRGRKGFGGRVYRARRRVGDAERRVVLFKPLQYMNRSGGPVRDVTAFEKADRQDVLVVLDDLALNLGRIRARPSGSGGGHKGLRDVIAALGGQDVPRLRVGIGAPPPPMDATAYVLQRFAPDEHEAVERAIDRAADAVEDWLANGMAYVMDRYNRRSTGGRTDAPEG